MKWSVGELWIPHKGRKLYGKLYMPSVSGTCSLVIISHGFNGTYRDNENFAEHFAENGIAAYVYDFIGGSTDSRSGGETTKMSVLTEKEELFSVIGYMKEQDFVDQREIFLMGESQGGFVSALGAAEHREDICGLMMLYPAFCIVDDARSRYPGRLDIPRRSILWDMMIGGRYYTDIWDMDVYREIAAFDKPVLIFHGTEDELVDLSYSQRAVEVYRDARLEIVEGVGHGFYAHDADRPAEIMTDFIRKVIAVHDPEVFKG